MADAGSNALFRCPVKVRPGPGCEMPAHLRGAFVECFAAAPDHEAALRAAVGYLTRRGYVFEDLVDGRVDQIDPDRWDEHVASAWPEAIGHLPTQAEMARLVRAGGVVLGPFCAWDSDS